VLELPLDHPRPLQETDRGALHMMQFSKDLSVGLKTLSRRQGATLFMTILAGFNVLLHYVAKQNDVVVGTDVANRSRVETENLIGFFVNQLVLRTRLSGNQTFEELLARVQEVTLEAYANQDLPFEKVVEMLNPDRNATQSPLFQVKLIINHAPGDGLALPQLQLKSLNPERTTAQLDITLQLWETSAGIGGWFNYNTDLFDAVTMTRFATLFEKILSAVVQQPLATVSELKSILAEEDEKQFTHSSQQRLKIFLAKAQRRKALPRF
jgi:non-ribosomal peptide synthetase component F